MNRNPDGWGIMALVEGFPIHLKGGIPENGKAEKGKKSPEDIKEFMDTYEFFKDKECAIHFRVQTHGKVDEENCHPYVVAPNVLLMHNGTLSDVARESKDSTKSDTWHFADMISEMAQQNWLRNKSFERLINIISGSMNRLLFLDEHGFWMPRPDIWHEENGIKYSNTYGIEHLKAYTPKSTTAGGWKGNGTTNTDTSKSIGVAVTTQGGSYVSRNANSGNISDESKVVSIHTRSLKLPNENEDGRLFLSTGTAIVRLRPGKNSQNSLELVREELTPSTGPTVTVIHEDVETPEQAEKTDELMIAENSANIPETLEEWKVLSLRAIEDLIMEEPEMVAEQFFDLVHGH